MVKLALLLLLFPLLAGCIDEGTDLDVGDQSCELYRACGRAMLIPEGYYMVLPESHNWTRDTITFQNQPFLTDIDPDTFAVKVFDAEGLVHFFPIKTEGQLVFTWEIPSNIPRPFFVTAHCTCWPGIASNQLNSTLILENHEEFDVLTKLTQYPDPNQENVTENLDVLHDLEVLEFPPNGIRFGFWPAVDVHGNATVTSPSGREVMAYEAEGRNNVVGHRSDGFWPSESGTWIMEMNGRGSVYYAYELFTIPEEKFAEYGVTFPFGEETWYPIASPTFPDS